MPFLEISNRADLARVLGTTEQKLAYVIYKIPDSCRYHSFEIPKRNGGTRLINAPDKRLKALQRKLADYLSEVYPKHLAAYGFVEGKNTYLNASVHLKRRWVVSIDIKDFFPSIHFGRVKGMFQSRPFSFDERLARELANLCCYEQRLPQGAPTSPVISNFICWKLDNQLYRYAKRHRCVYSRYADDITFSTNLKELPEGIGQIDEKGSLILSEAVLRIIEENKFQVNPAKIRYAHRNNRQEVTGIIVNSGCQNVRRTYVRRIRAMLHACEKYGVDAAASEHFSKYEGKIAPNNPSKAFMNKLVGMVGYVRYIKREIRDDIRYDPPVCASLYKRLKHVFPEAQLAPSRRFVVVSDLPVVLGEGKTDWKLLEWALQKLQSQGEFVDLRIVFRKYEESETVGWSNLLDFCEKPQLIPAGKRVICLFDGDLKQSIIDKIITPGKSFRCWGNNVYSVVLPKPDFRPYREISIEQYFTDKEIKTTGPDGRRLFLSDEFDPVSGFLFADSSVRYKESLNHLKKRYPFIIDSAVEDSVGNSLAMSKNVFAENVRSGVTGFDKFGFDSFRLVFRVLQEILALP